MPKKGSIVEGIDIVDLGTKGKVIGKKDGQVYLCKGAVPGDTINLQVRKNRKGHVEGIVDAITSYSSDRVDPTCSHFEHCGGCSWQNFDYEKQLFFKEKQVKQQLNRIGGFESYESFPILSSEEVYEYRNKLEFTFTQEGWLTPDKVSDPSIRKTPSLGFHVPGRFDWVLQIDECHLQDSLNNEFRNFVHKTALELDISFYRQREKTGILRNLVLRNNRKNEWMVLLVVSEQTDLVHELCEKISTEFSQVTSLWLILNQKLNDSYADCPVVKVKGDDHLIETFKNSATEAEVKYKIGPKSFFQTNAYQAERLYQLVFDWAEIEKSDLVYDLYTGTGTIALFMARYAKHVIGIEYVPESIEDAKVNSELNEQSNLSFYAGDMREVLSRDFIDENGRPDVLITDPPRAGMHTDVIERILEAEPKRIVYVSCDPSTQARDLKLLHGKYDLIKAQAVDMFPHTSHVENVAMMRLRK